MLEFILAFVQIVLINLPLTENLLKKDILQNRRNVHVQRENNDYGNVTQFDVYRNQILLYKSLIFFNVVHLNKRDYNDYIKNK